MNTSMIVLVGGIGLDVLAAIRAIGGSQLMLDITTSPANKEEGIARANALLPFGASGLGIILASILSGTSDIAGYFFLGTLALLYLLYAVKYSPFAVQTTSPSPIGGGKVKAL